MSVESVAIAVLVVVVAVVAVLAIRRELALRRIRDLAGGRPDEPLALAVRNLLDRTERSDRRARLEAEDLAYLTGLVGAGIVRLDDDLVVTSTNRAADLYLEVAQGSLVGRRLPHRPQGRLEGDADHAAVGLKDVRLDAIVRTAWRNGSAGDEVSVGGPDGRVLSVRARRAPGGGVWVVIDDMSELRRLQRIRTEFVDNLSHELRTPLTTVRLLTETLARDLEEIEVPPRVVDIVQKIDVETGHLVQMATELLDLGEDRAGAGPAALHRRRRRGADRDEHARAPAALRPAPGRAASVRDRPGRAAGARRPGTPRAAADQPRPQRDQVLAVGRRT